ncbi:MAG: hypothetical protein SZ59_C0002G0053 [candidate division TM6 bacterium GW2011_GWF2_28_16]|nr:MAG: hypothetical protein SZ59_C0002G0053 [candidate division TM6 bacterium GW2011_GWF2_28_16]
MFTKIIYFILFLLNFNNIYSQEKITLNAHLNSGWYPQDKISLENDLNFYIKKAQEVFKLKTDNTQVKVIITPHASYYYSGLCAATSYQTLLNKNIKNSNIKNVIILCPSHNKSFSGIAIPEYKNFKNILGNIKVNLNNINKLQENNNFKFIENVFEAEHAIEIQLPFLQHTIENFEITPLVVGNILERDYKNIADSIKNIIDNNTLIVISSDFIHYGLDYGYTPFNIFILDNIKNTDTQALYAIGKQSFINFSNTIKKTGATICGQNCIKILLKLLEQKPFGYIEPRLTCYYTSAQLSQARNNYNININKLLADIPDNIFNNIKNSVSYAGLIFTAEKNSLLKEEDQLTEYEKLSLYNLAKRTISNELQENKVPVDLLYPVTTISLDKNAGAFVTLEKNGNLQGCIGRIISNQELYKTVEEMAKVAAFNDTRFNPVTKEDLENLEISISILTQPKSINNYNDIILGKHGIILKKPTKSGYWTSSVFLPEVPAGLGWNLQKTLEELSLKAGLDKDAWQQDCNFEVFESFKIKSIL